MTATYTFDVFCTLDGYGSFGPDGDWGGYWSKQGPELLDRRMSLYEQDQRMVFGANTFREMAEMLAPGDETAEMDGWNTRMREMPATVVSSTLTDTLGWPDAAIVSGDATDSTPDDAAVAKRIVGAGAVSLSVMVKVCVLVPSAAPRGRESVMASVSLPSMKTSSLIVSVRFWEVSPGAKVSTPFGKS